MLAKSADDVHRALQRIHDLSTDADRRRRAGFGADIGESAVADNSVSHSGADRSRSERTAANQPFASFAANCAAAATTSGNTSGSSSQDRSQSRGHPGQQPRSSRHGGQSESEADAANAGKARGHFRNIIAVDLKCAVSNRYSIFMFPHPSA